MDPTPPRPPASASFVRDHLANERTFLAWVRTGLALIGLGFVLARVGLFLAEFVPEPPPGRGPVAPRGEFVVVGLIFLVLGTFACAWAGALYRRSADAIDAGRYEPARRSILTLALVATGGGIIITGLVLLRLLAHGAG